MTELERTLVLERLQELEGWSSYIVEALTMNQKREPATVEMLARAVDPRDLRELREISWSLFSGLHRINVQLEHSRGKPEEVCGVPS